MTKKQMLTWVPSLGLAVIPAAIVLSLATPITSASSELPPCYRISLDPGLRWLSTAVTTHRNDLAVVDSRQNVVRVYDRTTGKVLETPADPRRQPSSRFFPTGLWRLEDGFLLRLLHPEYLRLDRTFALRRTLDLSMRQDNSPEILGVYEAAVAKDRILAYGSVGGAPSEATEPPPGGRPFQMGFFTARLASSGLTEVSLRHPHESNDYYTFGHKYLAQQTNGRGYFLAMEPEAPPGLYEVRSTGEPPRRLHALESLPRRFDVAPKLETPNRGPVSAAPLFAELERKSLIAGLFSHRNNHIYVLTRHPDRSEGTSAWTLYELDPATDRKVGDTPLPLSTRAHHVSVAAGDEAVWFIERQTVEAWGEQEISEAVVISSSLIEDLAALKENVESDGVDACPRLK